MREKEPEPGKGTETGEAQRPKPPRRKWIEGLLLLAVLLAASVTWLTYYRPAESQFDALKKAGHLVSEETVGPVWFRKFAGKLNLPVPKRIIQFQSRTATDEDLAIVAKGRSLRYLFLEGSSVTDAGLAHLKELQDIQVT